MGVYPNGGAPRGTWLKTLTSTLIILDITQTSSNSCLSADHCFRQLFAGHVVRFSADGQEEKHATNTNFIVNYHWHFAPEQGVETGYDSKLNFTFGLCCLLIGYISFLLVWF